MNKKILPEECKKINSFVEEFGGITDSQLDLLLGNMKKNKDFYINVLKSKHLKEDNPGVYTPKLKTSADRAYTKSMEYCEWALLLNLHNEDGSEVEYFRTDSPSQLAFLKDGTLYKAAYIDRNGQGVLVTLFQQYLQNFSNIDISKMKGGKPPFHYLFVISDESVIDLIQGIGMDAPHTIVLVQYNKGTIPTVEYYK